MKMATGHIFLCVYVYPFIVFPMYVGVIFF
jgi:hypothetical protein